MSEHAMEDVVEEVASDAGADAGAIAAAIVAEPAAAEAAREAVEPLVEEVRELAERAEDAIDTQEEDAQWERMRTLQLESEQRITSTILSALAPITSTATEILTSSDSPSSPTAEAADELAAAADELAETVETETDGEATFDPLAVESVAANDAAQSGRRRPRGVRRRQR